MTVIGDICKNNMIWAPTKIHTHLFATMSSPNKEVKSNLILSTKDAPYSDAKSTLFNATTRRGGNDAVDDDSSAAARADEKSDCEKECERLKRRDELMGG